MKTINLRHLFILPVIFLLNSCISVSVAPKAAEKAQELSFSDPSQPFNKVAKEGFDRVWQSKKTGNSIAYLSECKTTSEPTLQTMEAEALSINPETRLLKSQESSFNQRASRETLAEATLDGVEIKMSFLFFKKNGCNFTLSYFGKKSKFDQEQDFFETFKKNFVVP